MQQPGAKRSRLNLEEIKMKNRQSGVDLLRCMGLLFVTCVHSFLYNGFYNEPQTGVWMWLANSLRWLFYGCNGLYMLMTGYLRCGKKWDRNYYRGLLPILVGYVLTCLVSFPIRHYLLDEPLSLGQWLDKMINFGNYAWYLEMYIGLILFAPVLNLALDQMKSKEQILALCATMITLTALPSITSLSIAPDYWESLYPITYYVLGAAIRKLQPKASTVLCLLGVVTVSMGLGLASLLSTEGTFNQGFGQGYGGFWITGIVVLLFLGLYRLNIPEKPGKVLAWLAGGCFEGYILSRLLDVWMYSRVPQWHTPEKYPLILLCITLPIYAASLLAGKAVHNVAVAITNIREKVAK